MSRPEAKQGKPVRTDSHFPSTTLFSQCTYMVVEDLCRVIAAVMEALFQYVPVVRCGHPRAAATILHYQVQ